MEDDKVAGCPLPILTELLTNLIPTEAHSDLIRPVTAEEIKSTIYAIDGDKTLGLMDSLPTSSSLLGPLLEVMLSMLSFIFSKPVH